MTDKRMIIVSLKARTTFNGMYAWYSNYYCKEYCRHCKRTTRGAEIKTPKNEIKLIVISRPT